VIVLGGRALFDHEIVVDAVVSLRPSRHQILDDGTLSQQLGGGNPNVAA
jgi:hypothetical protein